METNKQSKTDRIIVTTILVICLVGFGLFLAACNQETNLVNTEQILPTVEDGIVVSDGTAALPTNASGTVIEATETSATNITATPTEGEIVAATVVQQFVAPYVPNQNECRDAVFSGNMKSCMSLNSEQQVTHSVWEQLLPDIQFYLLNFSSYDQEYGYESRFRLVAQQDDTQYTAENFDQLLSVNNIRVTDENYELVAQAFALMTLADEVFFYEITFTHWEPIDLEIGFSKFDRRLQMWTELGGEESQWYFGFENGNLLSVYKPTLSLLRTGIGNYIPRDLEPDSGNTNSTGLPQEFVLLLDQ